MKNVHLANQLCTCTSIISWWNGLKSALQKWVEIIVSKPKTSISESFRKRFDLLKLYYNASKQIFSNKTCFY
jgi:hypothetical protein